MRVTSSIALTLLASGALPVHGQEPVQSVIHVRAPVLLESPLRVPEGLDPRAPVPLVIGLHGGGSSAANFAALWDGVSGAGFVYLALRAPYAISDSEEPAFDWAMWPKADPDLMRRAAALLPTYVSAAIAEVRDQVNVGRVYLVGFSQGAIYSYLVGVGIPEQLEGLVIFGGPGLESPIHSPFTVEPALPTWIAAHDIAGAAALRIFIAHGRSDPAAEFALAEESRDVLLRNGYDVTFRPFDGGHELPPDALLAEVASWIVSR